MRVSRQAAAARSISARARATCCGPGERPVGGDLFEPLAAKIGLIVHQSLDRADPGRPVDGVGEHGVILADLAMGGDVGDDGRRADRQALHHRQPETLGEGGSDERRRIRHQPRQPRVGEVGGLGQERRELARAFEHVDDVLVLPAAPPGDDEARRAGAVALDQPAPDREQKQQVLARLDGADIDEIGNRRPPRRLGGAREGVVDRQRHDLDLRRAQAALAQRRLDRAARILRVDDRHRRIGGDGGEAVEVALIGAGGAEFGEFDGNGVVKEEGRAHAGLGEPAEPLRLVELGVRAMEEHFRRPFGAQDAARQPRLGAQNVAQGEEIRLPHPRRPALLSAKAHRLDRLAVVRPVEPSPQRAEDGIVVSRRIEPPGPLDAGEDVAGARGADRAGEHRRGEYADRGGIVDHLLRIRELDAVDARGAAAEDAGGEPGDVEKEIHSRKSADRPARARRAVHGALRGFCKMRRAQSWPGAGHKLQFVNHCLTFAIFSIDSPRDL